jgi:hypothetical protein
MFSLRTHAIICGVLFAFLIGIPTIGNALQVAGVAPLSSRYGLAFMIFYFGLFLAFGLSAIPVIVMTVLRGQAKIGDGAPFEGLVRHQDKIIWAMWILVLAGTAVAIPAAIKGGLFDRTAQSAPEGTSEIADSAVSEGTLVARPGMALADMARRSTLKLDISHATVSGGAVFDLEIPDSGIVLRRCRYYFVSTHTHDPKRIEAVNVGTLPRKVSRAELERADADLSARLRADGWLAGHEEYRDEQDRQLHGGATRGPEGSMWLKNGIVLDIGARRMDDPVDGEDRATAGEWIQTVDLWARDDYPYIGRYAFAPAQR